MLVDITTEKIGFFIIDYSAGGGVERVTANLMNQFLDYGFNNLYLISLLQGFSENLIKDYPTHIKPYILNKKKDFAKELSEYLKDKGIKKLIFQADNMTIALQVLKATKNTDCKAYPQYHGSPYAYLKKYPDAEKSNWEKILFAKIQYLFKRQKLKKFIQESETGLFCVSEGSAMELKEIFKNEKKLHSKIKVIRNPILLKDKIDTEKENIITFVSRLERKHKNSFLIVKAWELVANQYPDWKLNIIGNGSLKVKMEAFCNANNIKNVEFLGFQNNVNSKLAKSKISVNTSNCEGFSMSIAEAIIQGNAIVATSSDGGIKDMLIDNETALISPKNNAKTLSENICKLIIDESLRTQLALSALKKIHFITENKAIELWLAEFNL